MSLQVGKPTSSCLRLWLCGITHKKSLLNQKSPNNCYTSYNISRDNLIIIQLWEGGRICPRCWIGSILPWKAAFLLAPSQNICMNTSLSLSALMPRFSLVLILAALVSQGVRESQYHQYYVTLQLGRDSFDSDRSSCSLHAGAQLQWGIDLGIQPFP